MAWFRINGCKGTTVSKQKRIPFNGVIPAKAGIQPFHAHYFFLSPRHEKNRATVFLRIL
jgi:hypothetical protein